MRNVIICPVVAGREMTVRAIRSALAQDIGDVEVIAIDNGSTDGCAQLLRGLPVTYWPRTSRSLNKVWNEALRWIFAFHDLDYALVINNDVVLRPDAMRLLRDDGGPFVTCVSVGNMEQLRDADPKVKRPHPDFSCFLIRKEVWKRVGEFDEAYWAYCSDCDYHLRMHKAGIPAICLSVPFFHESSGTLKQVSEQQRLQILELADQDRQLFQRRYGFLPGTPQYEEAFR